MVYSSPAFGFTTARRSIALSPRDRQASRRRGARRALEYSGEAVILSPMPLARWKSRLHEIMESPVVGDPVSRAYKIFSISLISASVLSVVLETVPSLFRRYGDWFAGFECLSVAIFTVEYVLHIAIADAEPRYARPFLGRLKFLLSPLALTDLIAILPFYLPLVTPMDLRFVRVLRLM